MCAPRWCRRGDGALITLLNIPRAMLALPADRLDRGLGRSLFADHGIGGILHQFLLSLKTHAMSCTPQELRLLERTALDLASGLLARQLDIWERLPAESREQICRRQPRTGQTSRRTRRWSTAWRPSTGTSVTVRPWYPCTFAVSVRHTGHGTAATGVRAVTTTASRPSATSSATSTGRPAPTARKTPC